jgi:hypothetical protein
MEANRTEVKLWNTDHGGFHRDTASQLEASSLALPMPPRSASPKPARLERSDVRGLSVSAVAIGVLSTCRWCGGWLGKRCQAHTGRSAALVRSAAPGVGLGGDVKPDLGIERVGIGRGAAMVVDRRIGPHLDHLPHRSMLGIRCDDVGLLLADHVEGNQGIAVDVGVNRDTDGLNRAQRGGLIRPGCWRICAMIARQRAAAARLIDLIGALQTRVFL